MTSLTRASVWQTPIKWYTHLVYRITWMCLVHIVCILVLLLLWCRLVTMHSQGTWSCVLVDLHHYNNPHDLIMISVMYTTCSYHGDQPLGEYLSHVSLAHTHSSIQTAGGMNACMIAAICTWVFFFSRSLANSVLEFLQCGRAVTVA